MALAGEPGPADRRRADDGARRDHPGADPRSARDHPPRDRHGDGADQPRSRRRRGNLRPRRRDVCGPHRRGGAGGRLFADPRHPYTRGPVRRAAAASTARAGGSPPFRAPCPIRSAMPQGCAFAPRCVRAGRAVRTCRRRLARTIGERPACSPASMLGVARARCSAQSRRMSGAAGRASTIWSALRDADAACSAVPRAVRAVDGVSLRRSSAAKRSASSANPAPANPPRAAWCSGSKRPTSGTVRFDGRRLAAAGHAGMARASVRACR